MNRTTLPHARPYPDCPIGWHDLWDRTFTSTTRAWRPIAHLDGQELNTCLITHLEKTPVPGARLLYPTQQKAPTAGSNLAEEIALTDSGDSN